MVSTIAEKQDSPACGIAGSTPTQWCTPNSPCAGKINTITNHFFVPAPRPYLISSCLFDVYFSGIFLEFKFDIHRKIVVLRSLKLHAKLIIKMTFNRLQISG